METLAKIGKIQHKINNASVASIKALHKFIFETEDSVEHKAKLTYATGLSYGDLVSCCNILDLDYRGSREDLIEKICSVLMDLRSLCSTTKDDPEDDEITEDVQGENVETSIVLDDISDNNTTHFSSLNKRDHCKFPMSYRDVEDCVRQFDGTGVYSVEGWISDFEDVAILFQWSELEKVIFAKTSLTEPRNFLEDARDIVVDHVRNIVLKHDSVKINAILDGKFVAGNKCANKSVNTKNCELFRLSDLREWYDLRVIEPILASLDEFQERDSGWALSRILNSIVNVNKYMPMHAGCVIQLPREIRLKKAVINVSSTDNACFAWSVVAALYPAESHVSLASSYPHYTTVLNIQDIEFPMTLNQIKKFEHINNISINVYTIENKKVLPIRVTDKKMERHVNFLYLEGANDVGHFAWIKNLSRLVCTQLSKHNGRKYFSDRYVYNKSF
ncbi:uncharacterized protein LOC143350234 [Colletes latitarsis]|uniref:uncharacterized protein LOC143350234 n=1 Tax=Colletes latitarsis TaxID=2605962 RepID=UPI0040367CF9